MGAQFCVDVAGGGFLGEVIIGNVGGGVFFWRVFWRVSEFSSIDSKVKNDSVPSFESQSSMNPKMYCIVKEK